MELIAGVVDKATREGKLPARSGQESSQVATTPDSLVRRSTEISLEAKTTRRRSEIMRVIDRFYGIDKPQDPPDDMVLAEMGKSWDSHLSHAKPRPVPTDRIEEVYEEAIIGYENKGPFGIFELLDGWKRICAREGRPDSLKKCQWPDGHIDEDLNVEGVLAGGMAVTLPCPSCRPEAHKQKRIRLLEDAARAKSNVADIETGRKKSASKKASKKKAPQKRSKKR